MREQINLPPPTKENLDAEQRDYQRVPEHIMKYEKQAVINKLRESATNLRERAEQQRKEDLLGYKGNVEKLERDKESLQITVANINRILVSGDRTKYSQLNNLARDLHNKIPWGLGEPKESIQVKSFEQQAVHADQVAKMLESSLDDVITSTEMERLGVDRVIRNRG